MKPTLDEFLATPEWPFSLYVIHPDFKDLYVRKTSVIVHLEDVSSICDRVVTIANIVSHKPGQGSFARLVEDLVKRDLAVYVECANEEFGHKLLRMGFVMCSFCEGSQNYVFNHAGHIREKKQINW